MSGERYNFDTRSMMAVTSVIMTIGSVLKTINLLIIGITAEKQWVALFKSQSIIDNASILKNKHLESLLIKER